MTSYKNKNKLRFTFPSMRDRVGTNLVGLVVIVASVVAASHPPRKVGRPGMQPCEEVVGPIDSELEVVLVGRSDVVVRSEVDAVVGFDRELEGGGDSLEGQPPRNRGKPGRQGASVLVETLEVDCVVAELGLEVREIGGLVDDEVRVEVETAGHPPKLIGKPGMQTAELLLRKD